MRTLSVRDFKHVVLELALKDYGERDAEAVGGGWGRERQLEAVDLQG